MHPIIDKIGIILLCIFALVQMDSIALPVLIFLVSAACTELVQIFPSEKAAYVLSAYGIICLFQPMFCLMLPLFLYDVLSIKKYPPLIPFIAALIFGIPQFTSLQMGFLAVATLIAALFQKHSNTIQYLQKKVILQRDQSKEVNLLLAEKNRRILEQQDNEIYMATLKERNRIAREIHDHVGHTLTRALLQTGALQILNQDESQRENIECIRETLNEAMTSIRSSVHDLYNTTINLRHMIQECTASLSEKYSVHVEYHISENVPKNVKLCLIGIIKESLSNVTKHSNATAVSIILCEHPAFYQLVIQDNGTNCKSIKDTGMGLAGMKERTDQVNGILTITPSDKGFRIFVSIPKKDKEHLK